MFIVKTTVWLYSMFYWTNSCWVSLVRVPDDSDSQSGVIRQRQNCLESHRAEGQEVPVLALAPCAGKEGVAAVNQVSRTTRRQGEEPHSHRNTRRGKSGE